MPFSVLNWAVAKTVLERDRPDADPADIARFSVLAALVPGVAGLVVPFIVENNLPEPDKEEPPPTEPPALPGSGGSTTLDNLGTKVDAANTKVDALGTKVDATNTKVDALGTKVDAGLSTLDTVKTDVADIKTKLDTQQPSAPTAANP
jgi:outer membrane murein-binding lipoprotein Lpp